MAHIGYDEAYRAARFKSLDELAQQKKDELAAVEAERDKYAPAKKTSSKSSN